MMRTETIGAVERLLNRKNNFKCNKYFEIEENEIKNKGHPLII